MKNDIPKAQYIIFVAAVIAFYTITSLLACTSAFPQDMSYSPAAWYEKGLKFADDLQYGKAIECFDRALSMEPDNERALVARGSALLTVGRFEDAYRDLNRAIEINPADPRAYYIRGLVFEEANNDENAAADYTSALKIDEKNVDYLYRRGLANRRLGRTNEAISDFRRACNLGYRYGCKELNLLLIKDTGEK
jgi:tetratricopeptide (TPR) repeat protein